MNGDRNTEFQRIRSILDSALRELDDLSKRASAEGGPEAPAQQAATGANGGNVVVTPAGDELHFTGAFSAGTLALTASSAIDARTGKMRNGSEILIDQRHGELFKRREAITPGQVTFRYDFGPAVKGPRSLVLIAEGTPRNRYVHGQADDAPFYPVRIPAAQACTCPEKLPISTVLVDKGSQGAQPVSIAFPEGFAENLKLLIPVIESVIRAERYAPGSIGLLAFAGCFWGKLACELAAKACILGCAGNPLCMAACLVAEVACLLAVDESKS